MCVRVGVSASIFLSLSLYGGQGSAAAWCEAVSAVCGGDVWGDMRVRKDAELI